MFAIEQGTRNQPIERTVQRRHPSARLLSTRFRLTVVWKFVFPLPAHGRRFLMSKVEPTQRWAQSNQLQQNPY